MGRGMIDTRDSKKREGLVRLAERIISESIQGRRSSRVLERYNRFTQYSWGEQKIRTNPRFKGRSVRNKCAEIAENRISQLTDNMPKWLFRSQEEGDLFTSDVLNQLLGDVVWDEIDWDERAEDFILEALAAGSAHQKTVVNPENGHYDTVIVPCPAFAKDPQAKKKSECRWFLHFIISSPEKVKQTYGVDLHAEDIAAIQEAPSGTQSPEITYTANSNNTAENVWNLLESSMDRGGSRTGEFDRCVIVEIWREDLTTVPIPFDVAETNDEHSRLAAGQPVRVDDDNHHVKHVAEHRKLIESIASDETQDQLRFALENHIAEHEESEDFELTSQLKYPRGHILTVSQGKLLRSQPNPLPMDYKDVWIKMDNVKVPGSYWGKPFLHDLYDMQDDLNHRNNSITTNINLMLNGYRTVRARFVKNWQKISNLIGINIPVHNHDDFKVTFPQGMGPQFFQDKYALETDMERQAGHTEIQQGRFPSGSPASSAIAQLDEKGTIRMRNALKHYAGALKHMGRNAIAIMAEFMDETELIRITNQENVLELVEWGKLKERKGLYDIRVDIASIDSTSRTRKLREAIELHQIGVYDDQAVLELLDDPKKYSVLQRKSLILQLRSALQNAAVENDALKKELNTAINRAQSEEGGGNVGAFQTSP